MDKESQTPSDQLLLIIQNFLSELEAERALNSISLDAVLDRDLGIDSLGKVELLHRVEKKFSIQLSEKALREVVTVRDLARLIAETCPTQKFIIDKTKHADQLEETQIQLSEILITDVLKKRAEKEPKRPHVYLQNEEGDENIIRYEKLWHEAKAVAAGIQKQGILPGETIAIMLPTCEDFFYIFAGCWLAGVIPVPIYPPIHPDQIEEYAKREAKILKNAEVRILVTFSRVKKLSDMLPAFVPSLKLVTTWENLKADAASFTGVILTENDTALIQYTSGSTGDPKGVVLTFGNLTANMKAIEQSIHLKSSDVNVSWLPLYHDMGLLNWLSSLYFGIPLCIMSPLIFLARPEKWLWAMHYHRATLSCAPNFAYEMCVKEIDDKNMEGLDLSAWRFAFCGSEAVNPRTIQRFTKKFEKFGFKKDAFSPAYGLAENTVALTIPQKNTGVRIDKVDRTIFENKKRAEPTDASGKKQYLEFVSCGQIIPEHEIRIVDNANKLLPERYVGNIQFKGPSAMKGYHNKNDITQKVYHDGFWDTGDLGYLADNDLFITGRKKDLIIKGGRNLYPEEVEDIVNQIKGVEEGNVIAIGVPDSRSGTEKLVVVAETKITDTAKQQSLRSDITAKMSELLDLQPDKIVFLKPGKIPKTASGKLQRSECKALYSSGKLSQERASFKMQLIKLAVKSFSKKIGNVFLNLIKAVYGLYVGIILVLIMGPLWLSLFFLKPPTSIKLCRFGARLILRLAFCSLYVTGMEKIKKNISTIYVANHASYVDSFVLLALLPTETIMVGKKEILNMPFFRSFIKRLNYLTVDRMDISKTESEINLFKQKLSEKFSICILPEGTFTYASGLRPFKLGAFKLAVETNTPVCPIALCGTREILRGERLLPKPGKIVVTICEPIQPAGNDWHEATRLNNKARAEIAKHCGEPMIDVVRSGPPQTL